MINSKHLATAFIITTEFCERICYYGIAGNLLLFLETRFELTNAEADMEISAWIGVCYLTPLIGGFLADRYLGRYVVICVFCCFYLLGLLLLVFCAVPVNIDSTTDPANGNKLVLLFFAIYLIALGAGGIKPNVSTLGADQYNDTNDPNVRQSYYNWFYFAINSGALVSNLLVAYLCQFGVPSLGGTRWSFFVGFSVPTIAMAIGLSVFMSGHKLYKLVPPSTKHICDDCAMVLKGFSTLIFGCGCMDWKKIGFPYQPTNMDVSRSNSISSNHDDSSSESGSASGLVVEADNNEDNKPPGNDHRSIDLVELTDEQQNPERQDDRDFGLDLIEDDEEQQLKEQPNKRTPSVLKLVPFLALMIPYWAIYSQLSTAFQNQGCQMNRTVGTIEVPIAALQAFDTIAVLALVPVFDRIVYPAFARMGRPLTLLQRIGAGFAVAVAAMCVAALVEGYRKVHAPSPLYYTDYMAQSSATPNHAAMISPCQSITDYDPYQYRMWFVAQEGGATSGATRARNLAHVGNASTNNQPNNIINYPGRYISKPASCSHTSINGSCINYKFYNRPGVTLQNGTTSSSCLIISCQPLPQVSSLSAMYQVPQFMLIGTSEVLSSIASLEFFYSQAAASSRGWVQSLNLLTTALGAFLMIPLVMAINSNQGNEWLPQNLDTGHLDWYFMVLAVFMAISLVVFVYTAKGYVYVEMDYNGRHKKNDHETTNNHRHDSADSDTSHPSFSSSSQHPLSHFHIHNNNVHPTHIGDHRANDNNHSISSTSDIELTTHPHSNSRDEAANPMLQHSPIAMI